MFLSMIALAGVWLFAPNSSEVGPVAPVPAMDRPGSVSTTPSPPGTNGPPPGRANLASYISTDDYPAEALRNHEEGTVGFRLHVGPDGLAHGCVVVSTSNSASLDNATCEILVARARFRPARDADGRPTDDYVEGRIMWRIAQ